MSMFDLGRGCPGAAPPEVTVCTSTIETRSCQFAELAASIAAQTQPPAGWLIHWDVERRGIAPCINELVAKAGTEWVFPMGDDDLFHPHHFATLTPHLTADVDVVWTLPEIPEDAGLQYVVGQPFNLDTLERNNTICAAAAVRRELWLDVGGYGDAHAEDWELWLACKRAGARFLQVPERTWIYRLDTSWPHRSREGAV